MPSVICKASRSSVNIRLSTEASAATIASRLKDRAGSVIADRYDAASILFADMAGFTARASDTSPDDLVLFLNRLAIALAFVGLGIAATYPFSKRFFALPQLYLGVAFGFGIPMAYAAVQNRLPAQCWLLLAANICYAFAYDTEYAMVDRDDDARLGIRTSALTLGHWDVAAVTASYALMLALLTLLGVRGELGWPYYVGLAPESPRASTVCAMSAKPMRPVAP